MLQTIEAKLTEVLEPVFYGSAQDVGTAALWNYIVFFRDHTSRNSNNTGYSDYYTVAVVHENWVPVEIVDNIVEKMESISGVRLASRDIEYNYTRKPGTNAVIEIASITFTHSRRKV